MAEDTKAMSVSLAAMIYIGIVASSLCLSGYLSYRNYVVREDFTHFLTEEEIPEALSLDTYLP